MSDITKADLDRVEAKIDRLLQRLGEGPKSLRGDKQDVKSVADDFLTRKIKRHLTKNFR